MKRKYLTDIDEDDESSLPDIPQDYQGNPMILPDEIWQNTVINFDTLTSPKKRRAISRVPLGGSIVLSNYKGKIVAKGRLRDLNEKSSGFEVKPVDLRVNEILYLQFLDQTEFALTQIKVVLRRVQLHGRRIRVGVEFVELTPSFQLKLGKFLIKKRREMTGFEELEDI